jgi:hypothetical protein
MIDFLKYLLTFLLRKNYTYYKLVRKLSLKLPREQHQAIKLSDSQIINSPILDNGLTNFTVYDLSTQKISITEQDLDVFFNEIRTFDFRFVAFRKYYEKHRKNILRLNPEVGVKSVEWIVFQIALEENETHPIEPTRVFLYHLKYEYKFTKFIYRKMKRRKKSPFGL